MFTISTRTTSCSLLLLLAVAGSALAQPAPPQFFDITDFSPGLGQNLNPTTVKPGVAVAGHGFRIGVGGVLQRAPKPELLSTPTGFGTLSNPCAFGDIDPGNTDNPRTAYLVLNLTTPTSGLPGVHLLSSSLSDTGSPSFGSWAQVDDRLELSTEYLPTEGALPYFVGKTNANGMAYLSSGNGRVLEVGGAQGSSAYSQPTTAAWLGSPPRPTATASGTAGTLVGSYRYKATYVTALGESMPSKPSASVTVSSKQINLSGLTAGGSGTLSRRLYRTTGGALSVTNSTMEAFTGGTPTGWTLAGTGASSVATSTYDAVLTGFEHDTVQVYNTASGTALDGNALGKDYGYDLDDTIKNEGSSSLRTSHKGDTGTGSRATQHAVVKQSGASAVALSGDGCEHYKADVYVDPANLGNVGSVGISLLKATSQTSRTNMSVEPDADGWTRSGNDYCSSNGEYITIENCGANSSNYTMAVPHGTKMIFEIRVKMSSSAPIGTNKTFYVDLFGGGLRNTYSIKNDNISFGILGVSAFNDVLAAGAFSCADRWRTIQFRINGYERKMYIDGVLMHTAAASGNYDLNEKVVIGHSSASSENDPVYIDYAWWVGDETPTNPIVSDPAVTATTYSVAGASLSGGWNTLTFPAATHATAYDTVMVEQTEPVGSETYSTYWDNIRAYTEDHKEGSYAARLTYGSADAKYSQTWTGTSYRGVSMYATGWVKCATANRARIAIYDDGSATTYYSDYHTGDNTWQALTVTHTMHASASTACRIECRVDGGAGHAEFDTINVYAGSGGYYLLDTIADNTTTTYTDSTPDSTLTTHEAENLAIGQRGAVPAGEWIEGHQDRLWSIGSTALATQAGLLWYSQTGDNETWPALNWFAVGDRDGDPATGIAAWRGAMYVFKRHSIWRLSGYTSTDWELNRVVDGIGCADGRTIAKSDRGIFFFGNDSLWQFDGLECSAVGGALDGEGHVAGSIYIDADRTKFQCASAWLGTSWYFGYRRAANVSYSEYVLQYDSDQRGWSRTLVSVLSPALIHPLRSASSALLGVSVDGRVVRFDGTGHSSTDQPMRWVSPPLSLGDYLVDKKIDRITASVENPWASTGTVYTIGVHRNKAMDQLAVDNIPTVYASKTFSTTQPISTLQWNFGADQSIQNAGGQMFRTLAVDIQEHGQSDSAGERTLPPPKLIGLTIEYRPNRRLP